jgi:hypothetical protein
VMWYKCSRTALVTRIPRDHVPSLRDGWRAQRE